MGKITGFSSTTPVPLKSLYLQASQKGLTFAGGPIVGALCNTRAAARSNSLIANLRRTGSPNLLVITNQPDFFGLFLVTLTKKIIFLKIAKLTKLKRRSRSYSYGQVCPNCSNKPNISTKLLDDNFTQEKKIMRKGLSPLTMFPHL